MSNIVVDAVEATAPVETTITNEEVNTEVTSEASAEEEKNVVHDKFAGKSTEEIIGSYQNLEK
jgi:hypothetical protein